MTIIKRADLGRPLTWDELDDNFQQVDDLTAAASAAVSSAAASATAAAGSAASSATSATDAANSAANAAAAIVSAVKSTITFTTGGTLNSNLDRISDGTYLYYWTGAYPVTVPADSTVDGTGGIATGYWAVDSDLLLREKLFAENAYDAIGKVHSYAELQNLTPTKTGEMVILSSYYDWQTMSLAGPMGGGIFVAVDGAVTDDGGYQCQPSGTSERHWQRVIENQTLTPEMFGAICDSTRSVPGTDSTLSLNNMFSTAVSNNFAVAFPSKLSGSNSIEKAYYVSSAVIATGIHVVHGDPMFHFSSSSFDTMNGAYAFCLGDPFTDRTTIQNGLDIGTVTVRDLDKRAAPMGGIYVKYTAILKSAVFRAIDCNGAGVEFAPVYDSTLGVVVERCGNITTPAHYLNGNGDENNSITYTSIVCHDCYHKGLYIVGSKIVVLNVHAEANAVLTTDDGYTGLTGVTTNTGLAYVNHVFYIVGGALYNLNFNDYGNADHKTYYDDQTTLNDTNGSHVAIALIESTVDNVSNKIASSNGGNIGRLSFFTGNTECEVQQAYAGHLYLEASARVSFGKAVATNLYSWSSFTRVKGGRVSNWGTRFQGSLQGTIIDAASMTDVNSYIIANNCTFNNTLTHLSSSTLNKFVNCTIPGIILTDTSLQETATFESCDIGTSSGVSISGGTLSTVKSLTFKGCILRGTWTGATAYDGIRFLADNIPGGTYSLGTWLLPRQTRPGTIVYNVKTSYTTGDAISYLCLTVDASGINTWKTIATV